TSGRLQSADGLRISWKAQHAPGRRGETAVQREAFGDFLVLSEEAAVAVRAHVPESERLADGGHERQTIARIFATVDGPYKVRSMGVRIAREFGRFLIVTELKPKFV